MTHKYRAIATRTEDGYFPSKKELKRWNELKLLEKAGAISHLTRNTKETTFPLLCFGGSRVCNYIADYVYREDGKRIAEDAKGVKTPVYKLKKKMFLAQYGAEWVHRES